MVIVKISGPGNGIVGDLIGKFLRDSGLKITHWEDVERSSRKPHGAARTAKAAVLVLEMRNRPAK